MKKEIKKVDFVATEEDKEFIRQLQKDFQIVDRPFLNAANELGITEEEVFERLRHYEKTVSYTHLTLPTILLV